MAVTRSAVSPSVSVLPSDNQHPPKRIALFTGNYNHIADGVSLTLNRLVAWLENHGHQVLVFGPTCRNPQIQHVGTFVSIPSLPMPLRGRKEYRLPLWPTRSVWQKLKDFQPDIIHLATPDLPARLAIRFAQKRNIPVVASYHTHFSSYLAYYGLERFEPRMWRYLRKFYGHCDHLYVPSPSMANVLAEQGICKGVRIWEHGVEPECFHPDHRCLAWRRELGFADDEVVIGFVSRLVWEKGLGVVRDVLQRLRREGIPHRSLIVGEGPIRGELQRALPDTVFAGYLKGAELARAYASMDVFLFPSCTETFGIVTLEAMASGLPCVVADAAGSRELVVQNVSGFFAPPDDPDLFYQYVRHLVMDHHMRKQMAEAAVEQASKFGWPHILDKMEGYYDEVVAEKNAQKGRTAE